MKRFSRDQLIVFDTTLRDGAQTPGARFSRLSRLAIANQLDRLGVNVIEAGFPISSADNFASVEEISMSIGMRQDSPVIAGFARTIEEDIESAWLAIRKSLYPRIHIVGTGSDIHLQKKYDQPHGRSRDQNLVIVERAISFARNLQQLEGREPDIEFSPEDCARADANYLREIFTIAIKAGATTLNVPDTIGIIEPKQYRELFEYLIANVPDATNVVWSTHTHDDYGLASINALSGVLGGAQQVEVTVNGIGERAGNAPLEQIVANAIDFPSRVRGLTTSIRADLLYETSLLVTRESQISVAPNTPVVGENAFTHESGIHQAGIVKWPCVYQPQDPEKYGRKIRFTLGPQSGCAGVVACAQRQGYTIPSNQQREFYSKHFLPLADKIGTVTDGDLISLLMTTNYCRSGLDFSVNLV